jgi:hypothetical protein
MLASALRVLHGCVWPRCHDRFMPVVVTHHVRRCPVSSAHLDDLRRVVGRTHYPAMYAQPVPLFETITRARNVFSQLRRDKDGKQHGYFPSVGLGSNHRAATRGLPEEAPMKPLNKAVGVAGAVLGMVFASAVGATAARPEKDVILGGFTATDTDICGFPVVVTETSTATLLDFDQTHPKVLVHVRAQDTFKAHGVTLVGQPYRQNVRIVFSSDGDLLKAFITGLYMKVRLTDGSLFMAAGRLNLLTSTEDQFTLTPDNGVVRNQGAFCAALSG